MNSQKKLRQFSDIVGTAIPDVYHYFRSEKEYPCAVWQEDDINCMYANNCAAELHISGTLDYFTGIEFDPAIDTLFELFSSSGVHWEVESIQYEPETLLIHYEIRWRY